MKLLYSTCAALLLTAFAYATPALATNGTCNKPVVVTTVHNVPEPATIILLGSALFGLGAARVLGRKG